MKARRLWACGLALAVFMTCMSVGIADAQVPGEVPDLSIWVGQWFKVTGTLNMFQFDDIGVRPTPSYPITETFPSYVKIVNWDSDARILTANYYGKDHSGNWITDPIIMDFSYFAGSQLNFVCSSEVETATQAVFGFTIRFKGVYNTITEKFKMAGYSYLKTLGGHYVDIRDIPPGSTQRWAGTVKFVGDMVPLSRVPLVLQGL